MRPPGPPRPPTVDDRRARASMADLLLVRAYVDSVAAQLQAMRDKLQAMRDMVPLLDMAPADSHTEYQVKQTDGHWHHSDAEHAARLRQQGRPIRQRQVTEWTEIEP